MANTVIALKKSGTSSAVPSSLSNGELAINYADGTLFYKHANGSIASISGGGGGSNFGTVDANGTLLISDTSGDVLSIYPGDGITIVGDAINDRMYINATATGSASNAKVFVSSTGPTGNTNGTLWWNTELGRLLVYYNDGDSNQWVEASPIPSNPLLTVSVSDSAPSTPVANTVWWNSNLGRLFIYYNDGDSSQWVDASPSSDSSESFYSFANAASDLANLAFDQSNAAYTQANTKLTNSSVTLAGSLTTTGAVIDSKGDVRDIPPNDRTSSMPYTITISDCGKMILANGNTAATANVFVPNNVFSIGNTVMITNFSTSTVTITQNSDVTMFLAGSTSSGNRTLASKGIATLICVGANNFIISGAGIT